MNKSVIIVAFLFFAVHSSYGQGTSPIPMPRLASIEMMSGAHYYGHIVKESLDTIFLQTQDGVSMKLPRASIESIDYDAKLIPSHFWAFGGVLGTPAGGNFVVGSYWSRFGIRLSFGYWGDAVSGLELSLPINLYRSEHTSQNIALVASTTTVQTTETDYYGQYQYDRTFAGFGPAYQVNLSGFSGELGLAFGSGGDFSSPQIMLQLGYVHEFR